MATKAKKGNRQKIVIVFDVCGSTTILENLSISENAPEWAKVVTDLYEFLRYEQRSLEFEIHKFLGDGWILVFDISSPKREIIPFLRRLADRYESSFKSRIRNLLTVRVNPGITVGMEKGTLISCTLNRKREYVSRAVNVAARLQSAIKQGDDEPEGKILMSKPLYEHLRSEINKEDYRINQVNRELRNVAQGQDYWGIKLDLYEKNTPSDVENQSTEAFISVPSSFY